MPFWAMVLLIVLILLVFGGGVFVSHFLWILLGVILIAILLGRGRWRR
jgi:hypothetical protein